MSRSSKSSLQCFEFLFSANEMHGFLISNNYYYDNDGYYNGSFFLDLTTVMSGNATLFVRLLVKLFGQSQ